MRDTRLEIQMGINYIDIDSTYISQNLGIRGIELKIKVKASLSEKSTKICFMYKYHRG